MGEQKNRDFFRGEGGLERERQDEIDADEAEKRRHADTVPFFVKKVRFFQKYFERRFFQKIFFEKVEKKSGHQDRSKISRLIEWEYS